VSLKNTADRWGPISQLLHWTVVLLVVALAVLGLSMVELPNNPQKIRLYALHKSLGLTVLGLMAIRLAWRAYAGAPHPVNGTPPWQERIARLTHGTLYLLLFAMPLTGWLFNSAAGFPLQWFGVVNLPRIAASDPGLREFAKLLHEGGFWLLLALVVVHAGAAFYHHLFLHDATLARMLPRRRLREIPHAPESRNVV
jgi:cytochrome b561